MNSKSLGLLAALTVLFVTAAALLSGREPAPSGAGGAQHLYPNLAAELERVSAAELISFGGRVSLRREGETWVVAEHHDYPAAMEKVRALVHGLAELQRLEEKTANPELYARLGVQGPAVHGSPSVQVVLRDGGGKVLADLVVGDSRAAPGEATRQELYVRRAGESPSWLALGTLAPERQPAQWLDRRILALDPEQLQEITLQPGRETAVHLSRAQGDGWQVVGMPEHGRLKSPQRLDTLAGLFGRMTFEEVAPRSEAEGEERPTALTARLLRADGLAVEIAATEGEGGNYLARFSASAAADASAEVKVEAEALDRHLSRWDYTLAAHMVDPLKLKLEELVETVEPDSAAAPAADPEAPAAHP